MNSFLAPSAAGAALAWHHPLSPLAAMGLLGLACGIAGWRQGFWLTLVPALLPLLVRVVVWFFASDVLPE